MEDNLETMAFLSVSVRISLVFTTGLSEKIFVIFSPCLVLLICKEQNKKMVASLRSVMIPSLPYASSSATSASTPNPNSVSCYGGGMLCSLVDPIVENLIDKDISGLLTNLMGRILGIPRYGRKIIGDAAQASGGFLHEHADTQPRAHTQPASSNAPSQSQHGGADDDNDNTNLNSWICIDWPAGTSVSNNSLGRPHWRRRYCCGHPTRLPPVPE